MTYRDNDQFRNGQMGWGNQGQSSTNRYGDQDFRGQERFSEPSGGQYSQGGYGQGEHWPSHRGDWGQGRMEGRSFGDQDQYGNASSGSMGGYGGQGYSQGQQYGGQGGYGGSQQSRGQGSGQQGYPGQGQMSGQGSWDQGYGGQGGYGNQRSSGWGGWDQGQSRQGPGSQGYGQGDWGSSRQGSANQGYGNQGSSDGGQGRSGGGTVTYTELWLIPGPHSGRGPRGYQRSGQRIEEDVCERLSQHGQLDASDIQVKVENGEVTLTGTVGSRQEKRMAEDALDSISGIKDVHNQLRVQQSQSQGQDQGGQSGRAENGRDRQGRSGKENANSSREKESVTASAG